MIAKPSTTPAMKRAGSLSRSAIPADWPVRPLEPGDDCAGKTTCGSCGLSWDDTQSTTMTPAPSGRCPFEYFHDARPLRATELRYGTVLRCYDNGGKTADRYTIIPPRWAREYSNLRNARQRTTANPLAWDCVSASAEPFHPQGVGQSGMAVPGAHLGRRVHWNDLPSDVQQFARQSFPEYAP